MRLSRRILLVLTAYILLPCYTAHATPVAIPAMYKVATAIIATGGVVGVYGAMKSGTVSTVNSTLGTLKRACSIAWIASNAGSLALTEKNATATMSLTKLQQIVNANPSNYSTYLVPRMIGRENAVYSSYLNGSVQAQVGQSVYITSAAVWRTVSSTGRGGVDPSCKYVYNMTYWNSAQNQLTVCDNASDRNYTLYTFSPVVPPVPPLAPATPQQIAHNLDASGDANGDVNSAFQAEIDKAFQDAAYVPEFTDDTTGLPFAYPPNALSQSAVDAANTESDLRDKLAAAVTAAGAAVTAAQNAYNAAAAYAAANPTNQAAQEEKNRTAVILENAKTEQARAQAEQAAQAATQAATTAQAEKDTAPSVATTARKSLNFESWKALRNVLSNMWPFTLLTGLAAYLAPLEASPVAPAFDLHIYGTNKVHIDLSFFDVIAAITRWVFGLLMTIGVIQVLVKWYRGVS